jgi:hypothetical protein
MSQDQDSFYSHIGNQSSFPNSTSLYLHSIGDGERRAMDVLDDRFGEFSHTDSHTNKKGLTSLFL